MKVIVDDFLDSNVDTKEIRRQLKEIPYARLEILLESPYCYKITRQ